MQNKRLNKLTSYLAIHLYSDNNARRRHWFRPRKDNCSYHFTTEFGRYRYIYDYRRYLPSLPPSFNLFNHRKLFFREEKLHGAILIGTKKYVHKLKTFIIHHAPYDEVSSELGL